MIYFLHSAGYIGPGYSSAEDVAIKAMVENVGSLTWCDGINSEKICKTDNVKSLRENAGALGLTKEEIDKVQKKLTEMFCEENETWEDLDDAFDDFYLIKIKDDNDIIAEMLKEWHEAGSCNAEFGIEKIRD